MNGRKQWFGSGYAGNNSQRLILCITQLFFSRIEIERMGVQECALWECEMRTADVAESLDVRKTLGARRYDDISDDAAFIRQLVPKRPPPLAGA